MRLKRKIALIVIVALMLSNVTVYASDESGNIKDLELEGENNFQISSERIEGYVGEEKYFYIMPEDAVINKNDIIVTVEKPDIVELVSCQSEEIKDEAIKEDVPKEVMWYKATGISAGDTNITFEYGASSRTVAVTIAGTVMSDEPEETEGKTDTSKKEDTEDTEDTEDAEMQKTEVQRTETQQSQEDLNLYNANRTEFIQTGWIEEDGNKYYLNSKGEKSKGIVEIDGILYYFDDDSGALNRVAKWIEKNGKRYYSNAEGVIYRSQFLYFGIQQYYMGMDGSVQKGLVNVDGTIYYADEGTGVIQKKAGWIDYDGKRFYSNAEGILYNNQFLYFGAVQYYMGADGSVQKGLVNVDGIIYYADAGTGVIQKRAGWIDYDGKKYYSNAEGILYSNQFLYFGTVQYYMGADGSVQKGVVKVEGKVYYADASTGVIQKRAGWIDYDGKKYYSN
ncbi:hypothetical protein, partial [Extibacter muris]|nr:hypothetical protein [Extibacter muris]MCQ4694190.1 hypothetical protein [Extibacter muris]